MQLSLCGPSYKHVAQEVNNQQTINMFPVQVGPEGRGKMTLIPTAGLSLLADLGTDPVRCMDTVGDYTYVVAGTSVYKLDINYLTKTATSINIGTITSSSSGTMKMAANPTQIMWVDGTTSGYIYTPGTGVFQEITATDADFTGGEDIQFIDSYFIVNSPNSGRFYFSASNNGLSWDPLDVATAETSTDNIVGLGKTKGELWVIGSSSTEIWYNAANATGSPFSLRTGLQIQIGCGAPDSIVSVDDLLVWLDNRGFIVQSAVSPFIRSNNSGYELNIISDEAITTEILSYTRRDDAIAMTYNDRGHIMYQITFPTEKKTWVYDYTTKVWHERSYYNSFAQEPQHHLGQFYAQSNSLHVMAGIRDGKVYLVSDNYYSDNGNAIRRTRVTSLQYDPDAFRVGCVNRIELRVGIKQHDISAPKITMRYSNDGGHTWSHHLTRDLGAVGEYNKSIIWNRLGNGREWLFEFTISEAMPFAIIDGMALVSELES